MGLIYLLLVIAIIGVIVWALVTLVPMPPQFKTVIIVVAVLFVLLWIVRAMFHDLPPSDIPTVHVN